MSNEPRLKITLVKSVISTQKKQRATVQALGLRKLNQSVEHQDNAAIRGMVARIAHLVEVEEIK